MRQRSGGVKCGIVTVGWLALLAGCEPAPSEAEPRVAPARRPLAPALPATLQVGSPAELFERMQAQMRLTPDRRIVAAFRRVDRLLGNGAGPEPQLQFAAGLWHVVIDGTEVGTLAELPTFGEMFALLERRATERWKTARVKVSPVDPTKQSDAIPMLSLDMVIPAMRDMDAAWAKGSCDGALIRRAAQAAALLAASLVDELGVADEVGAHALALIAVAEAATRAPMPRERALTARALGYAAGAGAIASSLPDDDPVRRYALDQTLELGRSHEPTASMLAAAATRVVAAQSERTAFLRAHVDNAASFPLLALRARENWGTSEAWRLALSAIMALREITGRPLGLPQGLVRTPGGLIEGPLDMTAVASALGVPFSRLLPQAEELLNAARKLDSGPWLASDVVAAYYAAQIFSALHYVVRFHVDSLGAPAGADEALATMGAGEWPLGRQFERHAADIVRAERRTLPLAGLVADVRELDLLGAGALARLFDPIFEQGAYSGAMEQAAVAVAGRCDSRVQCRALLTEVAYYGVNDLVTDDRLRNSIIAETRREYGGLRLRHAAMSHDRAVMEAALADPAVSPELRTFYLHKWVDWLDADTVKRLGAKLIAEAPSVQDVHEVHARWLVERGEPAAAIPLLDRYMKRPRYDHPLDPIKVRGLRARALHEAGRVDEAWTEIEPLLPSMYGGAMSEATYIKIDQRDIEAATQLAQRRLERYQDPFSVSLVCRTYWLAGKHEEAAALLEQWSNRMTINDWHEHVHTAFAAVFAKRPVAEAETAFREVVTRKVDLMGMQLMVQSNKLPDEHRYRLYSMIPSSGYQRYLDVSRRYKFLRAWKGEAEARKFIEQALPEGQREPLSQFGYSVGLYDLIWSLVPDPGPQNPHGAFIWLMRTAAYLRSKERPVAWRERLEAYYATPRTHRHDVMGQYLLGKTDEVTLWKASEGDDHRPEATWVMGLRAELDGDLVHAIAWYRATMQGARQNSGELQWANDSLKDWLSSRKSLALLAEEAKGRAAPAAP